MAPTLLIMAAGIGSRFGGGVKQLAAVGMNGEIIMDYSIHDAIEAGFRRIVFVIRKDIEKDFREVIGDRVEKICTRLGVEVAYAFQELSDIPAALPEGRQKPWGTGHAVLAARDVLNAPFAVINADDYYGKYAYRLLHDFLVENTDDTAYAMAGFVLKNTLSDNGGVTRGVCHMDNGMLTAVAETSNIVKTPDGAAAEGKSIDVESLVSMNMWALKTPFVALLKEGFDAFLCNLKNPLKDEFLLPIYIDELLQKNQVSVQVLKTPDQWFGVTYKEDREAVMNSIRELVEKGVYEKDLYSDLM
ncbi:MAG: nucleotidyltransferase [Clostridia bacterium]|nr:nucleotidyltransferase [Clostridia bacterium]